MYIPIFPAANYRRLRYRYPPRLSNRRREKPRVYIHILNGRPRRRKTQKDTPVRNDGSLCGALSGPVRGGSPRGGAHTRPRPPGRAGGAGAAKKEKEKGPPSECQARRSAFVKFRAYFASRSRAALFRQPRRRVFAGRGGDRARQVNKPAPSALSFRKAARPDNDQAARRH